MNTLWHNIIFLRFTGQKTESKEGKITFPKLKKKKKLVSNFRACILLILP